MRRRSQDTHRIPNAFSLIKQALKDMQYAARFRPYHPAGQKYRSKNGYSPTIYERAKSAETQERDLMKAIVMYTEAAKKGDRVDSCIKDFASVLHQLGHTDLGVKFLGKVRQYYEGDLKKFDRLKQTLQNQLKPSGKHECKSLLIELPYQRKATNQLLEDMFESIHRIKKTRIYNHLAFRCCEEQQIGKWLVLDFESFSAAKKTLQKFRYDYWFGVNKFWLKAHEIVCEAHDGREDFQNGLVLNHQSVYQSLSCNEKRQFEMLVDLEKDDYLNELSIKMIEQKTHDDSQVIKNKIDKN